MALPNEQPVTRIYQHKNEATARAMLVEDATRDNLLVVSTEWVPGRRRTRDWVAAFFLVWIVIGLVMVAVWLVAGKPAGTLTASLRPWTQADLDLAEAA